MSNHPPTHRTHPRRHILLIATLCSALIASACSNDATATSDDATNTSIVPLPREKAITTNATTEAPNTTPATATATTSPAAPTDDPAAAHTTTPTGPVEDRGAREITAPPTTENLHSPADTHFLTTLKGAGINTTGVEAQLIGAGHTVCTNPNPGQPSITVQAVAGQIVTQQRSTATPDAVAHAMTDAATKAYCPQQGH